MCAAHTSALVVPRRLRRCACVWHRLYRSDRASDLVLCFSCSVLGSSNTSRDCCTTSDIFGPGVTPGGIGWKNTKALFPNSAQRATPCRTLVVLQLPFFHLWRVKCRRHNNIVTGAWVGQIKSEGPRLVVPVCLLFSQLNATRRKRWEWLYASSTCLVSAPQAAQRDFLRPAPCVQHITPVVLRCSSTRREADNTSDVIRWSCTVWDTAHQLRPTLLWPICGVRHTISVHAELAPIVELVTSAGDMTTNVKTITISVHRLVKSTVRRRNAVPGWNGPLWDDRVQLSSISSRTFGTTSPPKRPITCLDPAPSCQAEGTPSKCKATHSVLRTDDSTDDRPSDPPIASTIAAPNQTTPTYHPFAGQNTNDSCKLNVRNCFAQNKHGSSCAKPRTLLIDA